MYPAVPVSLLVSKEAQQEFKRFFRDSGELATDPFQIDSHTERSHKKCVSVCLFKQNINNRSLNEFPIDGALWNRKYWHGLLDLVGEMRHFHDWKLRIYVERNLREKVDAEFKDHPQVEIYRMAINSVGASPGMLWRFMALADKNLDIVLVTDIDEPLISKADYIDTFEMDSRFAIGRIGCFTHEGRFFIDQQRSTAKNYATIVGSRVMSRPSMFDFDITAAMRGFMAYRRSFAQASRPWAYAHSEQFSVYNQPVGAHIYGWGSHWYMYGFDERFLKHTLYYHFAKKGHVQTWAPSIAPSKTDREGFRDLEYVQRHGNSTVYPHITVRLRRLRLSPEATRNAMILEEHRWIFEVLLEIIRQHSSNGVCGNLFFHDIADPFLIDLVPKQLNLFQAARHASKTLEIGFAAGHSAAIMLLANPALTIRAFDTCGLAYTQPCLEFLNSIFDGRITMVKGASQATVPADAVGEYDLIHIDGDHTYCAVAKDIENSMPKSVLGAIVVMDDYEAENDVARATLERTDLKATDNYTVCKVFSGSSHAIFHYVGTAGKGIIKRRAPTPHTQRNESRVAFRRKQMLKQNSLRRRKTVHVPERNVAEYNTPRLFF